MQELVGRCRVVVVWLVGMECGTRFTSGKGEVLGFYVITKQAMDLTRSTTSPRHNTLKSYLSIGL